MKLTNEQLVEQLYEIIKEKSIPEATNYIFKIIIEALAKAEREVFLNTQERDEGNKANGYRPVYLSTGTGKIQLQVPRVRKGFFKPYVIELVKRDNDFLTDLVFLLYSKGLSEVDVSEVLEQLYGEKYSQSQISRLVNKYKEDIMDWLSRQLDKEYLVLYIDALYQKVRFNGQVVSMSFYVVMGLNKDYRREVLLIKPNLSENMESWTEVFRELKERGLERFNLLVSDGLKYIGNAASKVYGRVRVQKCVVHLKRSFNYKLKNKDKSEFLRDLDEVFQVGQRDWTRDKAKESIKRLVQKWQKMYKWVKNLLDDWYIEEYLTYLDFDYRVQKHIYTTNWIESLNSQFRVRLRNRRVMPDSESVLLLLGSLSIELEERGRFKYRIKNFEYDEKLNNFET
jgi:transposase-like protein